MLLDSPADLYRELRRKPLLLTAGSITLRNGACLVVPTPSNKHRPGARQRSHHPDHSGGSTIPGPYPLSLGNLRLRDMARER
jgi:hypothetical protein